ncbi:MAG: family 43 glycosylhydrolase [Bacteroidota bacterium]|nr:family 43 glycosylhydrolase [Bacteroidota bacterium]
MKKAMLKAVFLYLLLLPTFTCFAQKIKYNTPGAGNPIIPGYFADPTVRKFGDTYYIYATTDGTGGGLGPSQVWVSKDFYNWTLIDMNWPTTHFIWAPDVIKAEDGKYYMYYCEPCMVYGGTSETPVGPWMNLNPDGSPIIKDRYVTGAITLDGQTFLDDDGSRYIYFGTWGIYKDFGCGWAKMNSDMKSFSSSGLIPNTQAKDFFEAPFMIKKDGVYYFTYSSGFCHDHTYRVQYAMSKTGPTGPFIFPANNPILETNADSTVHGPGHHSILKEGDNYYIVYHRHNLPNSNHGFNRQLAADKLIFGPNGIEKVIPTHEGIGCLRPNTNPFPNLALGKSVKASSFYSDKFKPENAVDDNNATLWRPKQNYGPQWIEIDLGKVERIQRIWTQFEYATFYYQYLIETSVDGRNWEIFSDKRENTQSGSPMTDYGNKNARYVRLTVTDLEKKGMFASIWNIKVFNGTKTDPPQLLMGLDADNLSEESGQWQNTKGMLGGSVSLRSDNITVKNISGRKAVVLTPGASFGSSFKLPETLGLGSPLTVAYDVFGTSGNILASLQSLNIQKKLIDKGLGEKILNEKITEENWHQIAFTLEGNQESFYIDGKLIEQRNIKVEPVAPHELVIENPAKNKSDIALSSFHIYSRKLEKAEIVYLEEQTNQMHQIVQPVDKQPKGLLVDLNANDYRPGEVLESLKNNGKLKGNFNCESGTLPVKLIDKRLGFVFNGINSLISDFNLPHSLSGNSSYTISGWVCNPKVDEHECIVDLCEPNEEMKSVLWGYGKHPDDGAVSHQSGWGDCGYGIVPEEGKWHHLAVTYDGYLEKVFVDGKLVKKKDVMLLMPENEKIVLGKVRNNTWGFSGALSSLKIYDIPLSEDQIKKEMNEQNTNQIVFSFNASDLEYGKVISWKNEGLWGGKLKKDTKAQYVKDVNGKIALVSDQLSGFEVDSLHADRSDNLSVLVNFNASSSDMTILKWNNKNGPLSFKFMKDKRCLQILLENRLINIPLEKIVSDAWHQFVMTSATEGVHVYFDGIEIQKIEGVRFSAPEGTINIGNSSDGKNKESRGAIGQVVISEKVLEAAEIERIYSRFIQKISCPNESALKIAVIHPKVVRLSLDLNDQESEKLQYYFFDCSGKSGCFSKGWTSDKECLCYGLIPGTEYHFGVKVRDAQGNVMTLGVPVKVTTSLAKYNLIHDDFKDRHDYNVDGVKSTPWSGVSFGQKQNGIFRSQNKEMYVESSEGRFDRPGEVGPYIYREVTDDFVAEVEIKDFKGLSEHREYPYNEGGIIVMDPSQQKELHLLQLSVFPNYRLGNMLTTTQGNDRIQLMNNLGWDYHRYLQVEKVGASFYLRTSPDGKNWDNMPGSPFLRPDLENKTLQVGLFNSSYSSVRGYFKFENFNLWIKK